MSSDSEFDPAVSRQRLQKFTASALRELAKDVGVEVGKKATKASVIDRLVSQPRPIQYKIHCHLGMGARLWLWFWAQWGKEFLAKHKGQALDLIMIAIGLWGIYLIYYPPHTSAAPPAADTPAIPAAVMAEKQSKPSE